MAFSNIPGPIAALFQLSEHYDAAAFVRVFADDAVVRRQGTRFRGERDDKDWSDRLFAGVPRTLGPIDATRRLGRIVVAFAVCPSYAAAVAVASSSSMGRSRSRATGSTARTIATNPGPGAGATRHLRRQACHVRCERR